MDELTRGSSLAGNPRKLCGRSVLLATADQLGTALALIELDGVVRRVVLCPPDLSIEHIRSIVASVEVDTIVSNRPDLGAGVLTVTCFVAARSQIALAECDRTVRHETEWILITSGTTGQPKLVAHTLSRLSGAIQESDPLSGNFVWSTFYDIRRYGGLQIFLRAVLTGGSLVLSSAEEPIADFLNRAGAHGVTHISGTPSHWRRALMSPTPRAIAPRYIRLSGEIADQSILDNLRAWYPKANIAHAFASTEAGVGFDVRDGLAGFPVTLIQQPSDDVEIKVQDGSLRIRSSRTAARYIGQESGALTDADGFVDTGDMVELRDGRYHFVGRRDGVINVGGLKVHPEEVETVINRHPQVRMSVVSTKKSPITGALVIADVVLHTSPASGHGRAELGGEILQLCRELLPRHKVPVAIRFVSDLQVAATGKLVRQTCVT